MTMDPILVSTYMNISGHFSDIISVFMSYAFIFTSRMCMYGLIASLVLIFLSRQHYIIDLSFSGLNNSI